MFVISSMPKYIPTRYYTLQLSHCKKPLSLFGIPVTDAFLLVNQAVLVEINRFSSGNYM